MSGLRERSEHLRTVTRARRGPRAWLTLLVLWLAIGLVGAAGGAADAQVFKPRNKSGPGSTSKAPPGKKAPGPSTAKAPAKKAPPAKARKAPPKKKTPPPEDDDEVVITDDDDDDE